MNQFLDNILKINDVIYFLNNVYVFMKSPSNKNPNIPKLRHEIQKCIYRNEFIKEIEQNIQFYCNKKYDTFKIEYEINSDKICFTIIIYDKYILEKYKKSHYCSDGSRK